MRQKGQMFYNHLPEGVSGWEVMRMQPKNKSLKPYMWPRQRASQQTCTLWTVMWFLLRG